MGVKHLIIPNTNLYIVIILLLCLGCTNETYQESLENGLENYKVIRNIDDQLIEGYPIQKLAFFKKDSTHYNFVYLLGNDAIKDSIEAYSLGMVVFPAKEYMLKDKDYLIWSLQPSIETFNNHKYIRTDIETKIKRMDSLHIFLFNREGYNGVLGSHMIRLKNIKL
jgi:hypothetical protein